MIILKIYRRGGTKIIRSFLPKDPGQEPEFVVATDRDVKLDVERDRIVMTGVAEPFSPTAVLVAARAGMFSMAYADLDITGPEPPLIGNTPPPSGAQIPAPKGKRRKKPQMKDML